MRSLISMLLCLAAKLAISDITSYTHADSLKATNPLGCIPFQEIESDSTAADVVAGATECLNEERYAEAAEFVMIASALVNYDTRRVKDRSSHMAQQTLFMQAFTNQPQGTIGKLLDQIDLLTPNSAKHTQICRHLRNIGPPTYFPKYMIAHGMDALNESQNQPLVEPFDAKTAWDTTLTEFTNCAAE